MNKINIKNEIKNLQRFADKNMPDILIGIGIIGCITAPIMAVKVTPKAIKLLEEKKKIKGEDLTKSEIVKTAWKCYMPTVTTCILSVSCIIGARNINTKRNIALATAYKLTETAFSEYKNKVIETIGEKKDKAIVDSIMKDKIKENPVVNKEVYISGKGNTLCYDSVSGRYFESDIETIRKAINVLNRDLMNDMYVSLNEFYYEIGLTSNEMGNDIGWNIDDGLIDVIFSTQIADDGCTPCIVLSYNVTPRYNYTKLL